MYLKTKIKLVAFGISAVFTLSQDLDKTLAPSPKTKLIGISANPTNTPLGKLCTYLKVYLFIYFERIVD